MQTPPCPACGTPLRWFPEMNAWGCDRCQQMMQMAPSPGYGPMPGPMQGGGFSHMPRTQAEKTRTFILLGILVVAIIGVIVMIATDKKKGGEEEEDEAPDVEATGDPAETAPAPAPAPAPATTPAPPPAATPAPATQATTPKGAPITIPECAEVAELRKKIDACAAIPEDTKKTLDGDADNKMSVFDIAPPEGNYAEMVRSKCAGTAESFKQSLAAAGCK
jgi:hypothetical protein